MRALTASAALLALLAVSPASAAAQRKASEKGSVSQTVDGTTVTIEYSRPVARGRPALFGGVVKWGKTWTPGANWATTFETDRDVHLAGKRVPKGKYSLWMIPRETGEWTVIVHTKAKAFHTQRPDSAGELVRFTVQPQQGPHMETLAFYFPVVTPRGATLHMHWGTTVVPLGIVVQPTRTAETLAASKAEAYFGTYVQVLARDTAAAPRADSAAAARPDSAAKAAPAPTRMRVEVLALGGKAIARVEHAPGETADAQLFPEGDHRFALGIVENGEIVSEVDGTLVFLVEKGRATGFELRGTDGKVMMRADRSR